MPSRQPDQTRRHTQELTYAVEVKWTGNRGEGTRSYATYARDHEPTAPEKPPIPGSSDPAFRGDASRYNPEDLLVSSLSACHMLWYLHLCADAHLTVTAYVDQASGTLVLTPEGGGHFKEVVLRPTVTLKQGGDEVQAKQLHEQAHRLCFIANSVNFPVRCEATIQFAAAE
jgi:organic hydroperoxide reductase OsmC/OhrA